MKSITEFSQPTLQKFLNHSSLTILFTHSFILKSQINQIYSKLLLLMVNYRAKHFRWGMPEKKDFIWKQEELLAIGD